MWIIFTLLAIGSQTIRNMFQKRLGENFSADVVSFSRFFYGIPFAVILYIGGLYFLGPITITGFEFWIWIIVFAIAAIAVKKSMYFTTSDFIFMQSVVALLVGLIFQSIFLLCYIYLSNKKSFPQIFEFSSLQIYTGTLSALGSLFWFLAFSLAYLIHVKIIAQIEFIILPLISYFYFKEKFSRNEIFGIGLIALGSIVFLVF